MKSSGTHKVVLAPIGKAATPTFSEMINFLIRILIKLGILRKDLDYHVVPFLMKDVVLFAASFYLLKQDVARAAVPADSANAY